MPESERVQATPLGKAVSAVGKEAKFGDPDAEVERVLRFEKNYYIVLKVTKETPANEVRSNYMRLSRLVHPDKCSHPDASKASAVLNQGYETLKNPMKKRLYDAYVSDVNVDVPEGMSYAEWEAQQAMHPVKIPAWLEKVLRIPGVALILLLILFPITLVVLVLAFVMWLVCLPIRCLCMCCGVQPPQEEQVRKEAGAGEQQPEGSPV
ncbi:hypothetical protein N2152v2_001622 [Parachlorella kessleri]